MLCYIAAMLRWKLFRYKWLALSWLLVMTVLFFLPGSDLPKASWMDGIYIDKWVHTGLFAGLLFLWRSSFNWNWNNYNSILLLLALLYGLSVEIVQGQWISNRSFDLFDLLCDMIGSVLGILLWLRVYKKNKPL
jgi:VanZ family protein